MPTEMQKRHAMMSIKLLIKKYHVGYEKRLRNNININIMVPLVVAIIFKIKLQYMNCHCNSFLIFKAQVFHFFM